ncbi:CBFA2T2 family protein [Megaselia abdita]
MMALEGKAVIKEEITEKDTYDSTNNNNNNNSSGRRSKGGNGRKDNCRTPDSPESARAVAPRSPVSPQQIHHSNSLAPPPRPNRNASSSPVVNGANTTPPPSHQTQTAAQIETSRLLGKLRKFLGSLVQFSQEVHPDVSDRIRALVLSLASGGITIDEFRIALQEAINLPLRPYVVPFLKNHITLLQRDIAGLARSCNQTTLQYVTTNDSQVMEFSHLPPDHSEIFLPIEPPTTTPTSSSLNGNGVVFKRRPSDTLIDHHNGGGEWPDYLYPPAKRHHPHPTHLSSSGAVGGTSGSVGGGRDGPTNYSTQPSVYEYSSSVVNRESDTGGFSVLLDKATHRDERDLQRAAAVASANAASAVAAAAEVQRLNRMSGEEEWKNIHTMLNCISAMVDKTKRAITILQQRGVDNQPNYPNEPSSAVAVAEIRRQTEEKVAEFKRNAEDAVNQVKRQAVIEIQRAVATAENRAADVMAQERIRMEKFFADMTRHSNDRDLDNKSPPITQSAGQNKTNPEIPSPPQACWNCGRKASETCSGCNLAKYCGAFCQHKDWEHHHQVCGTSRSDVSKHPLPSVPVRGSISRCSPPTQAQPTQSGRPETSSSSAPAVTNGGNSSSGGGSK